MRSIKFIYALAGLVSLVVLGTIVNELAVNSGRVIRADQPVLSPSLPPLSSTFSVGELIIIKNIDDYTLMLGKLAEARAREMRNLSLGTIETPEYLERMSLIRRQAEKIVREIARNTIELKGPSTLSTIERFEKLKLAHRVVSEAMLKHEEAQIFYDDVMKELGRLQINTRALERAARVAEFEGKMAAAEAAEATRRANELIAAQKSLGEIERRLAQGALAEAEKATLLSKIKNLKSLIASLTAELSKISGIRIICRGGRYVIAPAGVVFTAIDAEAAAEEVSRDILRPTVRDIPYILREMFPPAFDLRPAVPIRSPFYYAYTYIGTDDRRSDGKIHRYKNNQTGEIIWTANPPLEAERPALTPIW